MTTYKLTPEEYKEHMRTAPLACVDVVLLDKERAHVLLFRRTNEPVKGIFFTPGGAIEKGETFAEGAARKMMQELNIAIMKTKLEGPHVIEELWPNSVFPDIAYHAITTYFGYVLDDAEMSSLSLNPEHNESAWFSVNDATLHPNILQRIKVILGQKLR